jgi:hypothetical protein
MVELLGHPAVDRVVLLGAVERQRDDVVVALVAKRLVVQARQPTAGGRVCRAARRVAR